jgi:hypothetical protein
MHDANSKFLRQAYVFVLSFVIFNPSPFALQCRSQYVAVRKGYMKTNILSQTFYCDCTRQTSAARGSIRPGSDANRYDDDNGQLTPSVCCFWIGNMSLAKLIFVFKTSVSVMWTTSFESCVFWLISSHIKAGHRIWIRFQGDLSRW